MESASEVAVSLKQKLSKLSRFILYHQLEPRQIWSGQLLISINKFQQVLEDSYGYLCSQQELQGLSLIANESKQLKICNFHQIDVWTENFYSKNNSYFNNLTKNTQYCTNKSEIKKDGSLFPEEAQTVKKSIKRRSQMHKSQQIIKTKIIGSTVSESHEINHTQSRVANKNHASQLLNSTSHFSRTRDQRQQKQLCLKIKETALDQKWDYLIKIGQMNFWNKGQQFQQNLKQSKQSGLKLPAKRYLVETDEKNIKIIEQNKYGETQPLPLKIFDQKYQSSKKKNTKKEKIKNNMKGTMLLVMDKKEKVTKPKLSEKISQRDHELNYILLEVMRQKNLFQQQERILYECGINV